VSHKEKDMPKEKESKIISFIEQNPLCSSSDIHKKVLNEVSYATVKRILSKLASENLINKKGQGKGTKYIISPYYELFKPIQIEKYYEKEIDERIIKENYNPQILEILKDCTLFAVNESGKLQSLQNKFSKNIAQLTKTEYNKEFERLSIDLSWKSSQIEGNTYSLLETERLLKEKETASGKSKEEAIMLLNHKDAIDFIIETPDYLVPLTISKIEDVHSLLTKDLNVNRNIRTRRVGISGTNYRPIDNEFQIREALLNMCEIINQKEDIFEKSLIALGLISYIQPFIDGNKRTARIVSNAILINNKHCPISFRTVDSVEYKKAMLLFYEQNNIIAIKEIFINQFEFAVNTYF